MRYSIPLRVLCVALLPFLFVTACDSGGSNGGSVDNQFSLTIEPASSSEATVEAVQKELNGFSFFYEGENPNTGESAFGIYLSDNESFSEQSATDGLFGWVARSSDRPDSGSYNFTDQPNPGTTNFVGFFYEDFENFQNKPWHVIESGTIQINESSGNKVSGSIEATGTTFTFTDGGVTEETVTITGSFTAKDVETFVAFNNPDV